jgi:hypothetical protein
MQEPRLFALFTGPLEKSGIQYMVTGAVASVIYGEPRTTHDIDLVVDLKESDIARLLVAYPPREFYCPSEENVRTESKRGDRGHFNLIHHETGYKADIYIKGDHPLNGWAFQRRRTVTLTTGDQLSIAPPEYVILRKLEYYREGGSEKHLRDITGILEVSGEQLDRAVLDRWVHSLGLIEQWRLVQPN